MNDIIPTTDKRCEWCRRPLQFEQWIDAREGFIPVWVCESCDRVTVERIVRPSKRQEGQS